MPFDYAPLWKLLIDKRMTKEKLRQAANLSTSVMAKMGKGEYVSMEVIDRICTALDCQIEDVLQHAGPHYKERTPD